MDYLAPDFSSAALVTIDTQVDTLDQQPLEVPGTSAAVPKIAALAAVFRDAGRPIVHVVRLYRGDGSNVDLCRRSAVEAGAKILAPGSSGSQLAPGIVEHPASFTLEASELLEGRDRPAMRSAAATILGTSVAGLVTIPRSGFPGGIALGLWLMRRAHRT